MTQPRTISEDVMSCLACFNTISTQSEAVDDVATRSIAKLTEEQARFKIWAGSIGAHRTGSSSLDYRLRDASHIRSQVSSLLADLQGALHDANAIINGDQVPWDQEEGGSDDDEADILGADDVEFKSELDQIYADVQEVVDCLLWLSVAIRNPSPHDRFTLSSEIIDKSVFEAVDIMHVTEKFPKAHPEIVERLGKANSYRRQYFNYRESHYNKLSHGLNFNSGKTEAQTVASSIPQAMKGVLVDLDVVDVDADSDGGHTQTSYAVSKSDSTRLRVPSIPKESKGGPFQCPFCFMMILVTSFRSWRKHVFVDLQPYCCMFPSCPMTTHFFARRHLWMDHHKQRHWRMWNCTICSNVQFSTVLDLECHVKRDHKLQTLDAVALGEIEKSPDSPTECPLCREVLRSAKQYQRHVGRHLEDVALFVLPKFSTEQDEEGQESVELSDNEASADSTRRSDEYDEDISEQEAAVTMKEKAPREKSTKEEHGIRDIIDAGRKSRREERHLQAEIKPLRKVRIIRYKEEEPKRSVEEESELAKLNPFEKEAKDAVETYKKKAELRDHDRLEQHPQKVDEITVKADKGHDMEKRPVPMYTRMARRHLSIETLRVYNIDYQVDQDPEYLLIKRWVPEEEQDRLWKHTKYLRDQRPSSIPG